eukprot:7016757-Karenia_brevis.AAC.1
MPDSNTWIIFCVGLSNISAAVCACATPCGSPCPAFLTAAAWAGVLGTGPHVTLPVADSKAPPTA